MKNKMCYYLSNIILILYLILYFPLFIYVKSTLNENLFEHSLILNKTMDKITIVVVIISIIIKIIFNSKRMKINNRNKILGIVIFILELIIVAFINTLFKTV